MFRCFGSLSNATTGVQEVHWAHWVPPCQQFLRLQLISQTPKPKPLSAWETVCFFIPEGLLNLFLAIDFTTNKTSES